MHRATRSPSRMAARNRRPTSRSTSSPCDHGIGMSATDTDRVFDRFWRADPSRQRTTGGTGLGLAIAQEDAVVHGGRLEVWSAPGEGSCFRLTLPRRRGAVLRGSPLELPPPESEAADSAPIGASS